MVPHITDAIQAWVERVAVIPVNKEENGQEPQVCIIELGGTIGDIEGYRLIIITVIKSAYYIQLVAIQRHWLHLY